MGSHEEERKSSKHKRHVESSKDTDHGPRSKRRHKDDKSEHKTRKRHRDEHHKKVRVIDDDPDEDMWVEKNIDMDGERVSN